VRWDDSSPKALEEERQIPFLVGKAGSVLLHMQDALDALEVRLRPVLRDLPPAGEKPVDPIPIPPMDRNGSSSPMALALRDMVLKAGYGRIACCGHDSCA
jgi:hypothetical protein